MFLLSTSMICRFILTKILCTRVYNITQLYFMHLVVNDYNTSRTFLLCSHFVGMYSLYIFLNLKITNSKRYHSYTSRGLEQNNHIIIFINGYYVYPIITQGAVYWHTGLWECPYIFLVCLHVNCVTYIDIFPAGPPPQITVFFLEL